MNLWRDGSDRKRRRAEQADERRRAKQQAKAAAIRAARETERAQRDAKQGTP
jgi:hypothetical protein